MGKFKLPLTNAVEKVLRLCDRTAQLRARHGLSAGGLGYAHNRRDGERDRCDDDAEPDGILDPLARNPPHLDREDHADRVERDEGRADGDHVADQAVGRRFDPLQGPAVRLSRGHLDLGVCIYR